MKIEFGSSQRSEENQEYLERIEASVEFEKAYESRKWMKELPYFEFPSHWQIKIIPAFAMAPVRFFIRTKDMQQDDRISVYFDPYNLLGYMAYPYWEAYPINGDTERFEMNDVKGLIDCINEELSKRKSI